MVKQTGPTALTRRDFLAITGGALSAARMLRPSTMEAAMLAHQARHTPVLRQQPKWWHEGGLVMAGLDWESLLIRIRGGNPNFPEAVVSYDDNLAIWRDEHGRELASRLKDMGFNFVMIPLYKGGGLNAERKSLDDAKQFTAICHDLGLRVGCYTFSGTVLYEAMLTEQPNAKDWFVLDSNGKYATYGHWYFRRWVNRGHPGFRNFAHQLIHFAVVEAKMDLLHFDNYVMGPGYEEYSVQQFREYLTNKYSPVERMQRFGFSEMEHVQPPPPPSKPDEYNRDPIFQDFVDYRCEALAESYRDLAEYARSLNPDIAVECNPNGYMGELNTSLGVGSVDHPRIIQWGNAWWDEGWPSALQDGILSSHFRSQMLGRHFGNMVFNYTSDRVSIAEAMANNLQCLGCPAWVTGTEIMPSAVLYDRNAKEFDPGVLPSIRFFHENQQYYRDAELLTDIAVLNTFANTAYGPEITRKKWAAFTQALYQGKLPFTLLPEQSGREWSRYRVLVLADLALVSDELLIDLRSFVQQGGGLVITGQSAYFDEHNYSRKRAGLANLFPSPAGNDVIRATPGKGRAIYIPQVRISDSFRAGMLPDNRAELLEAVKWAANGPLQINVEAPDTVTMSLYSQLPRRRILHLVNYDKKQPVTKIAVTLQLPSDKQTIVKLLSPDFAERQPLVTRQAGRELRFTVPKLETYDLVIVDTEE